MLDTLRQLFCGSVIKIAWCVQGYNDRERLQRFGARIITDGLIKLATLKATAHPSSKMLAAFKRARQALLVTWLNQKRQQPYR
jgi:hypothetical protein